MQEDNLNQETMDNNSEKDCIFCKIARREIPKEFTYRSENFLGFLDINPKAQGHTLIIPKKHYKTLLEMPNTLGNELQEAIKKVSIDLIKKEKAQGINVISNCGKIAGQVVHHLHIHIIPRKSGDGVNFCV